MARKKISADEMIQKFNEAYLTVEGHDPANGFRAVPEGATGAHIRGYTTVGMWTARHTKAVNAVTAEYEQADPPSA